MHAVRGLAEATRLRGRRLKLYVGGGCVVLTNLVVSPLRYRAPRREERIQ